MVAHRSSILPSNCLHVWLPCCAHIIHLIITGAPSSYSELSIIGDVHAFEYIGRVPAHYNATMRCS